MFGTVEAWFVGALLADFGFWGAACSVVFEGVFAVTVAEALVLAFAVNA